ncbi:hypothetical protein QJQ45_025996, partial [Haematococcus lacustris]
NDRGDAIAGLAGSKTRFTNLLTMPEIPPEILRLAAEQTRELTNAEAIHVFATIKQTLEKLGLVGLITVDPKVQAQELTQSVGEEITRMIGQQKELESQFEELISAQHTLRQLPNKTKLRQNQTELQHVAEALRQSTKQLCRNLKDNPNVAENMAKVAAERQALSLLLSNALSELEVFRKITPIIESVLAQEAAKVQMEQTIEHERTTSSAVKQLRNDLKDEKSDHEEKARHTPMTHYMYHDPCLGLFATQPLMLRQHVLVWEYEMREKKKMVASLKEQLKELKMNTAVGTRYLSKASAADSPACVPACLPACPLTLNQEYTAGNEAQRRLENTELSEMRKELTLVQQQIEIESSVHAATVDFLRRLSTRLQEESIAWGQRHDSDLQSKERDLEQLKQNHMRDERRLREAEERWRQEMAKKKERENKDSEEREREDMAAMLHAKRVWAATKIQASWRGFWVRKGPSAGKKGKKGGKGKSGKKSGKKK